MSVPPRRAREGRDWIWRDRGAESPVLLRALPAEVPFGFLGRLLPTDEDLRLDLEILRIPAPEAMALLERTEAVARAELIRGERGPGGRTAELAREAESAVEVADAVAGRRQELFRVGIALRARAGSRAGAAARRAELVRRLVALGFRPRVPEFASWDATEPPDGSPARRRPPGYWHTLSTDGLAAFFPCVDETVLEPGGIVVGALLDGGGPVILDRFAHGSHSWGLFGTTGSGKSFAAALWSIRTLWTVPDLELYVLDPLGEFGALAPALGGARVVIGPSSALGLAPLDPARSDGDRAAAIARAVLLLRALFPSLRDEESAAAEAALGRLYGRSERAPTMGELLEEVRADGPVAARLETLLEVFRSGSLRDLERPGPAAAARTPVVYDLSRIPEAQRAFHLTYLLDGLYDRLRANRRPKLVVVDEAHLLARTPMAAEFLDRLVRHVRHFRTGLLLLSQRPDDFLAHEAGRSLLANLRATALLRLAPVSPEAERFFDLTAAEAAWLPTARLPRESGYSEALLRSGPSHRPLAVVATPDEREFLAAHLAAPEGSAPVERHV